MDVHEAQQYAQPQPQQQPPPQAEPEPKANGNGADGDGFFQRVEAKEVNGAWVGVIRLRKPVVANGETVSELSFREPSGGDIERIGNPVAFSYEGGRPKMQLEAPVMLQMMAFLAGTPPSTMRQLHPKDWNNGAWLLASFFIPDQLL